MARLTRRLPLNPSVLWPADHPERRSTVKLIPNAKNARWHTDEQVRQIAASIATFGFTIPVLIDEHDEIIAGHGRVLAAQYLRLEELPVLVARGWTDKQKLAYSIADNKLTESGEWNEELLRIDLRELTEAGFDVGLTAFSERELDTMLAELEPPPADRDPDEIPLLEQVAVTRPGDLWLLGPNRLLCGDATNRADVARLLASMKPNLMVTDPPYGVDYDPDWRNRVDRANGKPSGARAIGIVTNDQHSDWRTAWALFPGDVVYTWAPAGPTQFTHYAALVATGFEIRTQIIWVKSHFPIGRGDYHLQHEPCWYAVRPGATSHWNGDRTQSTVWHIDKPQKSETGHSTQKPVECMQRPIENNSELGDAVYDPFLGSGTTLIAATITNRICLALEIEPLYVDIAVRRWQTFTGESPRLAGDNLTFESVATMRIADSATKGQANDQI